jgi:hypothetical protein
MKKQTTRAKLRELLTERYVPLLFAAGFSGPNKISGNKLFHDFTRKVGEETHHLSIMFEKWQRPRFVVDLAIEPPGGYEPIIVNGGEVIQGRLTPVPGPSTRSWFRADPPWWKRMIFPHTPTRENEAVEECVHLWPEVEAWWAIRSDSEHIRLHTVRYPGTKNLKGYFERARQRAKRRRSPWNLVLIPLGLGSMAFICYGLFQFMWRVHTWFHPNHVGRFRGFWAEGIGFPAFVSSFVLFIPLVFAAIPLGMIFTNAVAWCIPPARRAFDREAEGIKWASSHEAMSGLIKIAFILVPICLLLSFIGAVTLRDLK